MSTMELDKRDAFFAGSWEGCYLYAYPDPATNGPPWTIALGHTDAAGEPKVRPGMRVTLEQAFEIFRKDLTKYSGRVLRAVKVPLKQWELGSLTSFDLNCGAIFSGSIDEKLNRGDRVAAMATMGRYVNAAGKYMRGLENRRKAEIDLFMNGNYGNRTILVRDRPDSAGRKLSISQMPWGGSTAPSPIIEVPTTLPTTNIPFPEKKPQEAWYAFIIRWLQGLLT